MCINRLCSFKICGVVSERTGRLCTRCVSVCAYNVFCRVFDCLKHCSLEVLLKGGLIPVLF